MAVIPLGKSAYQRADLPPVLLRNFYYERAPTNLEDQVAFHPRPRLKTFTLSASIGTSAMKGLYREGGVLSGRIFAAANGRLYKITQNGVDGAGTVVDLGAATGDDYMTAEGDPDRMVFTLGATPYSTNGTTISTITMPDSVACIAVDTLDARYLFAAANSNVFYWSDTSTTTINALSFASAESQPDVLVSLKVVDDVLWLIGRLSLEAWRPTGDSSLPYERIEGRVFGIGCTARATVQKMNVDGVDSMCWVGTDQKVYRLDPNPVRISDFGLEERLLRADPEALYAHTANWNGHDFYVLHIPTEGSFAYDLTTGEWSEWSSYGADTFRTNCACIGQNNVAILGDDATGALYTLSEDDRTDVTSASPVVFEFSGLLKIVGPPTRNHNVRLDTYTGLAESAEDDPMVQLATSDDHGKTWKDRGSQPLRRQGERAKRVLWRALGMLRRDQGRVYRWRTTEPVIVTGAKYNEKYR
jgi:hypothetical protein